MISYAEASEPLAVKWNWCQHQGLITAVCPALELVLEAVTREELLHQIQEVVPPVLDAIHASGSWDQYFTEHKVIGAHAEELHERWVMHREQPYIMLTEVSAEEFVQL